MFEYDSLQLHLKVNNITTYLFKRFKAYLQITLNMNIRYFNTRHTLNIYL